MSLFRVNDPQVVKAFDRILNDRCALKPGEQVLIVADHDTDPMMINAFESAATRAGGICTIAIVPNGGWMKDNVYKLTAPVEAAFMESSLIIAITTATAAGVYGRPQPYRELLEWKKEKTRMFAALEVPFHVAYQDGLYHDYDLVERDTAKVRKAIQAGKKVRITSTNGTDLTADIFVPKRGFPSDCYEPGTARKFGAVGGVTEGEVHFPPPVHTINGTVVIDGPVANLLNNENPDEPIRLTVKNGRITNFEGGTDAKRLKEFLGTDQNYISEIAIGTRAQNLITNWNGMQYRKTALGNLHVAYGGWWGFQDRESVIRDRGPERASEAIPYRIHGDMVIYNGTYEIDGKVIMEKDKLIL